MTDENEKVNQQENEEEKPEIYSVKKGEEGFAYNRRDFLVTAAAGTAAIVAIGAGIDALTPDGQPGQAGTVDESQAVSLEVEALGLILVPLARGIEQAWKITNLGKNTCPRAVLRLTAAHDPEFQQALQVPEIAPGQSVEIPVSLTAPGQAGEYRYQWQLRIGDGAAKVNEFLLKVTDAVLAESAHPYLDNTDLTWTINNPDTLAASSQIHFTRLEVESDYDLVYVRDGVGSLVQTLTGIYPTGLWSSKVNGAVVKVQLTSDDIFIELNAYWGFQVDQIRKTTYLTYLPYIRKPVPTPTSYVICSCNTVELCICNLVCVCEAVCSCVGYCSCDTVCSCVGYCSCNRVHYWYPN